MTTILVQDAEFQQAFAQISEKFQTSTFLTYAIVWIVLIWILRAWRLSKATTLLTRLWTQLWVAVVFWIGAIFVVPFILWGNSYKILLGTVIRAILHQF